MKIGTKDITQQTYIIAEAGSNHDGSLKKAKKLIASAASCGADAVKFQLFTLKGLIHADQFEKVLNLPNSSWREKFRKLEFPLEWLPKLKRYADKVGIDLLFTPFDLPRLQAALLVGTPAIKIASGDITHFQLLKAAGKAGVPVILSTGASSDKEIKAALSLTGKSNSVLLDCVMQYPAEIGSYGLERLLQIRKQTGAQIGLSDHTQSLALPVLAVANGASVIEKHFTLNSHAKGADHAMSTEPADFARLVTAIRDVAVLSTQKGSKKRPDTKERVYARRGLYAAQSIRKGEKIQAEDIIALRPALTTGLSADSHFLVVSKRAKRAYTAGELLSKNELKK